MHIYRLCGVGVLYCEYISYTHTNLHINTPTRLRHLAVGFAIRVVCITSLSCTGQVLHNSRQHQAPSQMASIFWTWSFPSSDAEPSARRQIRARPAGESVHVPLRDRSSRPRCLWPLAGQLCYPTPPLWWGELICKYTSAGPPRLRPSRALDSQPRSGIQWKLLSAAVWTRPSLSVGNAPVIQKLTWLNKKGRFPKVFLCAATGSYFAANLR